MASAHVADETATEADRTIAATIEAFMAYRRVSQEPVAKAAGLTQPQLSRRLRCHTGFRASEVAAIARFLNVSVGQLYDGFQSTPQTRSMLAAVVGEPGEQAELALEFADEPFTQPEAFATAS